MGAVPNGHRPDLNAGGLVMSYLRTLAQQTGGWGCPERTKNEDRCMRRLRFGTFVLALLAARLVVCPSEARAQNVLSVRNVTVSPGVPGVVIPIDLTVAQDLSLLRFDVTFDTALCALLVNPNGITVRKAGRTVRDPEQQPTVCSDGVINIAVLDLLGGTVIPSGSGLILEIVLGDLMAARTGALPLAAVNILARQG